VPNKIGHYAVPPEKRRLISPGLLSFIPVRAIYQFTKKRPLLKGHDSKQPITIKYFYI